MDSPLAVAEEAVRLALAAGATEADATSAVVRRFNAEARHETLVKLEQSTGRSLTLRAFVAGAKATLSTTDLSAEGMQATVRRVVEAARYVAPDPLAALPDPEEAPSGDALGLYADDVRARGAEEKIADALAMEAGVRRYDPRVTNSAGSRSADTIAEVALANSRGFRGSYRTSSVLRVANPIAQDGEDRRNAAYGSAARSYAALESVAGVAAMAAQRAVDMCGARKPATARLPVIFERDVAAAVLSDVFASVNAANVAVGNSFLAGSIGEQIGSDLVTIVDDGLLARGLGTVPFDAEGVPSRTTVVFERGVLRTFLYDTYYGRKLGAASTANASGAGSIGPSNFYLQAGAGSLDDLIAATPRGVLILDTIGFATEHVTGTYSRGARGFMIEGGELAYPIDEFTIAGNFASMLAGIDAIANDLRFDGSVVSPSFRVAEMTIG